MKRWFHKIKKWNTTIWPAIIWSAFVFLLLIVPLKVESEEGFLPIPHFDKAIHVFLFSILSLLWHQYLVIKKKTMHVWETISFFIIIVLYGVSLECIQNLTGRDFDIWDMAANATGAMTGIIIKKSRTV
jgi:VanZ family protein